MQRAKVQSPPLRDETLTRDRLLDWLHVKIHHRVVFVLAEAGYGKTTLLADFSRRTRLRTLWYRLEEGDRSWTSFMRYLVAAGREQDGAFASRTATLLDDAAATGPSLDVVLAAFIEEIQELGETGAVLILDDYHLVDESTDVQLIMRELLAKAPERVTFLIASRRATGLPVARLRALGEVAELTTDDLRFSASETEQLFRVTYHRPLEPDVVNDLSRRTEGWAASLQLVQAAIRGRSARETRSFVRSLSGAEGDLYDYLAEEVVGDLDPDLQRFLMLTSVLDTIETRYAHAVAAAVPGDPTAQLSAAERMGLVSRARHGRPALHRFHPLVQQFLQVRLARELGEEEVRQAHHRVADAADAVGDWARACHHLAALGEGARLQGVLASAVPTIMARGEYGLAHVYLSAFAAERGDPEFEIIRSRVEFASGNLTACLERARSALELAPKSEHALANLISLEFMCGRVERAHELALALHDSPRDEILGGIAKATAGLIKASLDGHLPSLAADLETLAHDQDTRGQSRYHAITLLNLATTARQIGDAELALRALNEALPLLEENGGPADVVACRANRAWAFAHLGQWETAVRELDMDTATLPALARAELFLETGLLHAQYGDQAIADEMLRTARPLLETNADWLEQWRTAALELAVRTADPSTADRLSSEMVLGSPISVPGHLAHQLLLLARVATLKGDASGSARAVRVAIKHAESQGAGFYREQARLLEAARESHDAWNRHLKKSLTTEPVYVTLGVDVVCDRLDELDADTVAALLEEARHNPLPWRQALRRALARPGPQRLVAGELLDEVGNASDVPRLRSAARALRTPALGKRLARKLAAPVYVEDQGRVSIRVGGVETPGSSVRRKVLAALCYLVSRPGFSATKDQILEALWPDLDPDVATNSLNQTIYFLRRIFEPAYIEAVSPEYVHHDSDVIWLDSTLCHSRSGECFALIRDMATVPTTEQIETLSTIYQGKFALDFAYEDWAADYRDSLHASYLQIIENAVSADTATGHFDRAIRLARRALLIDPDAEELEVSLLRLYRIVGAHSAAAEQYGHYASSLRADLGIEPAPLDTL